MDSPSRYDTATAERRWQELWEQEGIYRFDPADPRPLFVIDTPPPTISGEIHIGHVYSYVQAEAMARFWRMQGYNVYYPFGFDDNGLPTERYVERRSGVRARDVGRAAFVEMCLQASHEIEGRFESFWKSLGMSVDWHLRYSTIDPQARAISQWSFLDLHRKGLVYRAQSPNPWCIECRTAIAQAEMDDNERETTFYTLNFGMDGGAMLPIATTRPELLAACVAVFVHPEDGRYRELVGGEAVTPLFGRRVPILADGRCDPAKGSGAVMCCTFGDTTDVAWWREYQLPLIALIERDGRLGTAGGAYAGLNIAEARACIIADMRAAGALQDERRTPQSVRVHERCGTPLEILETPQWYIRLLDAKEALLEAGRRIAWHPAYMQARYEHWVANLNWDWCISRQRYYGVPFPVWHCTSCGASVPADETQLPVDPTTSAPPRGCTCGGELLPDEDVMDTWATSSVSPQIAAQMFADPELYARLFPMQLRPQAHDIIRTWAFYTIVKSYYHFGQLPWQTVLISGHALDQHGRKFSKSKGNAPVVPSAFIERYGADAVRYWACGGAPGSDQNLSEEEMRQGKRLVTKLWNAARLLGDGPHPPAPSPMRFTHRRGGAEDSMTPQSELHILVPSTIPTDRALLSWLQRLIRQVTEHYRAYEYHTARDLVERFFWGTFCDYYLEWIKGRLYEGMLGEQVAARATGRQVLLTLIKLLAPIMPHISEEIYAGLFAAEQGVGSIHRAAWPQPEETLHDPQAERCGEALVALTDYVRRYKSARGQSLGTPLVMLRIAVADEELRTLIEAVATDLRSVTRAQELELVGEPGAGWEEPAVGLWVGVKH